MNEVLTYHSSDFFYFLFVYFFFGICYCKYMYFMIYDVNTLNVFLKDSCSRSLRRTIMYITFPIIICCKNHGCHFTHIFSQKEKKSNNFINLKYINLLTLYFLLLYYNNLHPCRTQFQSLFPWGFFAMF